MKACEQQWDKCYINQQQISLAFRTGTHFDSPVAALPPVSFCSTLWHTFHGFLLLPSWQTSFLPSPFSCSLNDCKLIRLPKLWKASVSPINGAQCAQSAVSSIISRPSDDRQLKWQSGTAVKHFGWLAILLREWDVLAVVAMFGCSFLAVLCCWAAAASAAVGVGWNSGKWLVIWQRAKSDRAGKKNARECTSFSAVETKLADSSSSSNDLFLPCAGCTVPHSPAQSVILTAREGKEKTQSEGEQNKRKKEDDSLVERRQRRQRIRILHWSTANKPILGNSSSLCVLLASCQRKLRQSRRRKEGAADVPMCRCRCNELSSIY